MNDQDLIVLVQESPIDDLTLDQIQQLRARLPESLELRDALRERLEMDHHLVDALGASGDTPDQFVQKILQRKQRQNAGSRWIFSLALALVLIVGVSIGVYYQLQTSSKPGDIAATDTSPTQDEPSNTPEPQQRSSTQPAADSPMPAPQGEDKPEEAQPVDNGKPEEEPPKPEPVDQDILVEEEALIPRDVAPLTFAHLTSLPDADHRDSLTRSQFDSWLTKASDKLPSEIQEFRDGDRPQTRMKGWFRLRGQLPANAALRFEMSDIHKMRFHFYCGDQGVSIMRHQHDYSPWFAYAMTAGDDGIQPKNLLLQSNDGYREHRGPARHYKPVAFFFDEDSSELVFYRGDVEVIRTPLPSKPDRVYFEGESIIRHMNLWPLAELPKAQPDYPQQAVIDRTADLPWQSKLAEQTTLEKNVDGTLSLVSKDPDNHSWTVVPIPGYGIRMVELELTGVDRSHGVFLTQPAKTPKEGETAEVPSPQDGLVFNRNRKTAELYARFSYIWDSGHEVDRNPLDHPAIQVGDHVWVRLFAGGGQVRGWVSLDGKHWALLSSEDNDTKGVYNHLGISASKVEGEHRLTIQKMVVRELPGLTGLFPEEHWKKVDQVSWKELGESPYPSDPFTLPDDSKLPADLATRLRRFSCVSASYDHMKNVCEEAIGVAKSNADKRQVIKDMLALMKTWPLEYNEKRFIGWCEERLGNLFEEQLTTRERQDYASFRRELLNLPTMNRDPMGYFSQERFNTEMLMAIQQERWNDILDSCETMRRYYSYDSRKMRSDFPIINWAGGIAVRHSNRANQDADYLTEGRSTSLLVEDLSKEAYNISAELNAALESDAIADACRLITQIPESAAEGLAPSGSDPDHLFSVTAAIQMAVQNHEALQHQMEKEHADLAQLRVNSAIQRGDRKVVELVTLQFFDTKAAAEAHLWLGDQATSAGDFASSLQHYIKAARSAEGELKSKIDARLLMLGHMPSGDAAQPNGPISIGSTTLTANSLIDETSVIRTTQTNQQELAGADTNTSSSVAWPESGSIQSTNIVLRGSWGREQDRVPTPVRDSRADWRGQALGMTTSGSQAYLCNRFELWKLDLNDQKEIWKRSEKDKDRGKAHDYSYSRCVPLLVGDMVVTRMLHEKGFALYGFDRESGDQRWVTNLDDQMVLATDPISVQGRVLIVTLREVSQSTYAVRLSRVDLSTGEILDSHPLFRIRDTWFDRGIGNVVAHREQLLIDLGGVLASCDISGHLQWVRKQLTFPQKIDSRWANQQLSNIEIVGNQAISFHAGTLRLECFDVATGTLRWTMPGTDVQSIKLLDDNTLLVEQPEQWLLVSADDGKISTKLAKPENLLSWQVTKDALIGMTREQEDPKDERAMIQVVRIDTRTGESRPLQSTEISSKEVPAAGPLFYGPDKWLLWQSEDQNKDERTLMVVQ
ncbi:PQQ-binding-like beta-propeller repeat protein [Bremerella sp.]|uniref:outer membrane protein assembly factor BamB family protein n=1 Tax=Bremerella sp. TaxID=2795602 RepID=UPI00391AE0D6